MNVEDSSVKGCGKVGISLQPVESSLWSKEKCEKEGAAERSCYGLTTAPYSPSPAPLGGRGVKE